MPICFGLKLIDIFDLLPLLVMILAFGRFVRRGFCECSIEYIPEERRTRINISRRSKYYMKKLLPDRSGFRLNGAFT